MSKKLIILGIFILTLLTLNICTAQELDNSTELVNELSDSQESVLEAANHTQTLEAASVKTHIDVAGKTNFDVIGDYFKVKLI